MHHGRVALCRVGLGQAGGLAREFLERGSGLDELVHAHDAVVGDAIGLFLLGRGSIAAEKGPGDIDHVAFVPMGVGVHAHEIARHHDLARRLRQPRIGVGARRHEAREERFAVASDERVAQDGEQLVLADAGADRRLEFGQDGVADPAVDLEELDFLGGLHLAGIDGGREHLDDGDLLVLEGEEAGRVEPVHGETLVLEAELAQCRANRLRPLAGLVARGHTAVLPRVSWAHIAHDLLGDVHGALVLEEDGRALGRHEAVAREGAGRPHAHDVGARRVADVRRGIEKRDGEIVALHHRLQAREPARAELGEIDPVAVCRRELGGVREFRHGAEHSAF